MLTIFLVDDETIELDLMENHIDWASMGIQVVGTARNGRKAWEQIQRLQPDIVLTDVRMPVMDGLRLAALIQEKLGWIQLVFLSGHDEFTYVKSAIESGAVGYLLKPIDRKELFAVMDRSRQEVEKIKLLRRSRQLLAAQQLSEVLTAGDSEIREQAWRALSGMDAEYRDRIYVTALISLDGYPLYPEAPAPLQKAVSMADQTIQSLLDSRQMGGMAVRKQEHEWLLIIEYREGVNNEPFWQDMSSAIRGAMDWTATIGICDTAALLNQGYRMFKEAEKAVGERFYRGYGGIIRAGQVQSGLDADMDIEDEPSLQKMNLADGEPLREDIGQYFDRMARVRLSKNGVLRAAAALLDKIAWELAKYGAAAGLEVGDLNSWNQRVRNMDTINGIKEFIQGLTGRISGYLADRQQDRHALLVQKVVHVIETEYFESLTIEYLAGKVYLSPNYLRVLFKEKKGCTIHEYLTRIRLQKAVELLGDKTLRIHDVARKVGYDNTSYFCSFFYKTQGVTPNEYRKKFL